MYKSNKYISYLDCFFIVNYLNIFFSSSSNSTDLLFFSYLPILGFFCSFPYLIFKFDNISYCRIISSDVLLVMVVNRDPSRFCSFIDFIIDEKRYKYYYCISICKGSIIERWQLWINILLLCLFCFCYSSRLIYFFMSV